MRNKKELKTTTNNTVYRKVLQTFFHCSRCPPNKGCNRFTGSFGIDNNWKNHRSNQWRSNGI